MRESTLGGVGLGVSGQGVFPHLRVQSWPSQEPVWWGEVVLGVSGQGVFPHSRIQSWPSPMGGVCGVHTLYVSYVTPCVAGGGACFSVGGEMASGSG